MTVTDGDRDVDGAGGQGDGHHGGAPGDMVEFVQQNTSKADSRKPKPMYFKRKRGIVPDGLVQMRLSNFIQTFPSLQPSGVVTMGGGLTNDRGAASQRNFSTNQRAGISGSKRKWDQDQIVSKRWRESAEVGVTDRH